MEEVEMEVVFSNAVAFMNTAPTATGVSITSNNGGIAVGNKLMGNYTYVDIDNDPEATSKFRWLRDGLAISDATFETYTLVIEDSGSAIIFEVTPAASTGTMSSKAVSSSAAKVASTYSSFQTADVVIGQNNFISQGPNQNGAAEANTINSPFSSPGVVNGALYLADYSNHRVLGFNSIPTVNKIQRATDPGVR